MLSLKQIGTICFTTILSLFIFPSYSYITNSSNCNQVVLQTDTGPAALEANYSANRINTTWYSNGTALSGNGVPSSCTYDAALVPPTPDARPGYAFGGWTLRAAAPVVPTLATVNLNTDGSPYSAVGGYSEWYDSNNHGTSWRVEFNYDSITAVEGIYDCRNPYTVGVECSGAQCWCQLNGYELTNGTWQSSNSYPWVYLDNIEDEEEMIGPGMASCNGGCYMNCAWACAQAVASSSAFRTQLYGRQ